MKRKLLLLYLRVILDSRFIGLRRRLTELRRQLTLKKRVVHVFLQLDDPYSYLLSQYLEHVITHYRSVEFRFYLCQVLRGDFMPQPDMLAEYSVTDCRMLVMEFGVPFLDRRETQTVEYRRPLLGFLAGEQEDENFGSVIIRALAFYWRGDAEGAAGMLGKIRPEQAVANVQVGRNQLLLRKIGHYSCATMHYAGEWYWGVDRLPYLIDRLHQQGLKRYREAVPELESLARTTRSNPPARAPAKARELPPLEMFYSFRSPYSYIALARVFELPIRLDSS
jgi:2-hydroxychromene-2-carboxylate isomerase